MQTDLKAPAWANGEALSDQSNPGVSIPASIDLPESLLLEPSARQPEEA